MMNIGYKIYRDIFHKSPFRVTLELELDPSWNMTHPGT
jgi:hypothetical protein